MEPLSSIVTTIGDLLALATAAVNLVVAIRFRTRHNGERDQGNPEGGGQVDR